MLSGSISLSLVIWGFPLLLFVFSAPCHLSATCSSETDFLSSVFLTPGPLTGSHAIQGAYSRWFKMAHIDDLFFYCLIVFHCTDIP